MVAQLLQFMEDALGVNVRALAKASLLLVYGTVWSSTRHMLGLQALPPKPFPKLPVKLLEDVSPDGPLHLIASHCHSITKSRGLKRVDFANPGRRKEVRFCSNGRH